MEVAPRYEEKRRDANTLFNLHLSVDANTSDVIRELQHCVSLTAIKSSGRRFHKVLQENEYESDA
jgi:hypothetical protein